MTTDLLEEEDDELDNSHPPTRILSSDYKYMGCQMYALSYSRR